MKSTTISLVPDPIDLKDRRMKNGRKSGILWLTYLSGAGKSTLAVELERRLFHAGFQTYVLDGDNICHGLSSNFAFGPEERSENIRRVGEVAALFARAGLIPDFTGVSAPYEVPETPELTVETGMLDVAQSVDLLVNYVTCVCRP